MAATARRHSGSTKASRREDHDDDDPRRTAECERRSSRVEERHPSRAHQHWRYGAAGRRHSARPFPADAQRLSIPHRRQHEEAERIYALLSDGGEIFMPMEETFFASASRCSGTSSAHPGCCFTNVRGHRTIAAASNYTGAHFFLYSVKVQKQSTGSDHERTQRT